MTVIDPEYVSALIADAADTLVLPRFRRLRPEDIEDKSTSSDRQDLVTIVDRDVEEFLTRALTQFEPGATVIGEEAVHADPLLLGRAVGRAPVWFIDPIDGTKNFARGKDGFGIMVSRVVGGETTAAWVTLPARGQSFVAEAGGGAWLNRHRVTVPASPTPETPRGRLMVRYMPPAIRAHVVEMASSGHLEVAADSVCAAVEYTQILCGDLDFAVYFRLLPWDHAAPALILTEAGGCVRHLDGQPYTVRSENQVTVVARSQDVSDRMRVVLTPR